MAISGMCACCGRAVLALYTCKSCGSRVCPDCVDARNGVCKLCGGIKRLGKIRK